MKQTSFSLSRLLFGVFRCAGYSVSRNSPSVSVVATITTTRNSSSSATTRTKTDGAKLNKVQHCFIQINSYQRFIQFRMILISFAKAFLKGEISFFFLHTSLSVFFNPNAICKCMCKMKLFPIVMFIYRNTLPCNYYEGIWYATENV